MPLNKKMLPNARKRVTASARARIPVKKSSTQLDGSYVEPSHNKTVRTVNGVDQTPKNSIPSTNDAIMVMLQEIKESNVALARRMYKVEQSSVRDIPLNQRLHAQGMSSHSSQLRLAPHNPSHIDVGSQIGDPLTLWI